MKAKVTWFVSVFALLVFVSGLSVHAYSESSGEHEIKGTIRLKKHDVYSKLAKITLSKAYKNFHASMKSAKVFDIELSEDNGYLIYDVLFWDGKQAKEAKIDAGTGKVLAIDKAENNSEISEQNDGEAKDKDEKGGNIKGSVKVKDSAARSFVTLSQISLVDAIKKAVLQKKGFVTAVSLENADGYLVYSINIYGKNKETEIKIDAGNGKILSKESGKDDEHEKDSGKKEGYNDED